MLYHRAVHSKIGPPVAQRPSNLAYNRFVTSGVVAGAALVCSLAISSTGASSSRSAERGYSTQVHLQVTDTDPKKVSEKGLTPTLFSQIVGFCATAFV